MEVRAQAKFVHISPQKTRLVTRAVKGKMVEEALAVLQFTPKKAARLVRKLVESALANAGQHKQIDVDTLYIKRIWVDGGPSLRRFRARAMGRATRVLKRSSHITVVLDEKL